MEDEWEEEEQLVVAELSGMIDSDVLRRCEGWAKVVGLDSEQPVLQLGRYVFAGEYEDAVGTCVIFQEDSGDHDGTACSPTLRYKCHTAKKLMLQRTFLSERKEGESGSRGIEVLSLNEGDVCGRASTVCHYVLDPTEKAEDQGPGISDESDAEMAERGQTSTKQDSMLDISEAAENDSHIAEPTQAENTSVEEQQC
ncbi:general transcription factor 3C polypeptide 6 [Colossoma macropomum]|uniref:general transcription factor 3C polypeptide 6 n=1 Tax=Colossoma macropomum TaxID=42526 RepID=UPI001864B973|nr:general transcription factor 3C polypeptide 6 [Colossoma macropomum]